MNGLIPQKNGDSPHGDQFPAPRAEPEPPATPSSRKLTPEQQVVMDRVQRKADIIKEVAFSAAMATAIPIGKEIGAAGFKVYLDGFVKDAGSPSDPVELVLIGQIVLAHHRVAQLHAQAEHAKSIDEAKVFTTAAVRLTGELRRLALALKQYREPASKKSFAVVKQQTLVAGNQQIAYLDQQCTSSSQIPLNAPATEQRSKRISHAPQALSEPQTSSCRPAEPALARPIDARGTGTAAAGGAEEQAMATFYGADI